MAHRPNEPEIVTPTEARQASPRLMNFRVLIVSLIVLAVLGLAIMSSYWQQTGSDQPVNPQTQGQTRAPAPATTPAPSTAPQQPAGEQRQ